MELLQQPEIKSKYDKCKYKVKYWEHQFKKKNGRLPSKLDIREASHEIRLAYKTYFNLKSAALEQSFQDIDGFNSDDDQENSSFTCNIPETSSNEISISNETCNQTISTNNVEIMPEKESSCEDTATLQQPEIGKSVNSEKTWGNHLNNVVEEKSSPKYNIKANSSFTQKLFKSSNLSKRNLRKSLSLHHVKSDTNLNSSGFSFSQPDSLSNSFSLSQPNDTTGGGVLSIQKSASNELIPDMKLLNNDHLRVTKLIEPVKSNSINLIQSVLDDNVKTLRNVDPGWMQRVAKTTGTKLVNKTLVKEDNFVLSHQINIDNDNQDYDGDSDDIIGDSDEEDDSKLHFNKRRKLNDASYQSSQILNENVQLFDVLNVNENANSTNQILPKLNSDTTEITSVQVNSDVLLDPPLVDSDQITQVKHVARKSAKSTTKAPRKSSRKTKNLKDKSEETEDVTPIARTRPTRARKTIIDLNPDNTEENFEPFENDEDQDPDFSIQAETQKEKVYNFEEEDAEDAVSPPAQSKSTSKPKSSRKPRKSATKKKSASKETQENDDEEDNQDSYELEYSIKPRRVTVPRDSNFKNVLKKLKARKLKTTESIVKDVKIVKSKEQIKKDEFEKKVASGNLNQNYVRINLEKKIYSRGKRSINFSKYKKNQWKQKNKNNALCGPDMDMGGCDGGQLTCFNCGQVGHFAQKCPFGKEDKLLSLAAEDQEYCPFPTLEEASAMAKGSQLFVRKTRIAETETGKRDKNEDETEKVINSEEDVTASEVVPNSQSSSDESSDDEPFMEMNANPFDDDDDDELLAETIKLEEYVSKVDQQQFIDNSRAIKPYYKLTDSNEVIDTPQEVFDVLSMFGHNSFRPGQEKAIMRILSGKSTLVTLSTGSGKSLCYQIPAYLVTKREPCIALIISPLVSLMEDQVTGIPSFLKAECLHTNKTKLQRERILNTIATGDLHILLVSPEAVVAGEKQTGFGSLLRKLPPVAFACIDEAHCVSQWSHNFRPSYLMICSILKERLGISTILGLTATATRATCDSIIRHLSITDGREGIISDIPLPNNLRLTVSKDGNRDSALLNMLFSERFETLKSVIVYCTRRQECERIASFLRTSLRHENPVESEGDTNKAKGKKRKKLNIQAEPYHAGLSASKRRSIQNSFMRGDLRIVVATVAFGMGINKSDIRSVIHYNLPKNFESYVQEVGRAGRDGLPAHCHLFLDAQGRDENELQRHIFANSIDRHVIRKLNAKIFVPCTCKGICPKHEVAFSIDETVMELDIPQENISTLLCYLELHEKKFIEVLSPAYTKCRIAAYGSGNFIRKAAQDCPPLAMALAMFANKDNEKENIFEFPIVDVAAAMGWDSGICKYKLKNLEWNTVNNQPKRSLLTVQFLNLGFRLLAPGNLTGEQLDDVLDTLHQRVADQEKCALLQLKSLHDTVTSVAESSYRMCINKDPGEKELRLKHCIREYFESPQPLAIFDLDPKPCDEGLVANDCRAMISMYRDNNFTGRALARIFYGIQSPNYPAVIWGRCKYWRAHINSDFHSIVRIATKEILKSR